MTLSGVLGLSYPLETQKNRFLEVLDASTGRGGRALNGGRYEHLLACAAETKKGVGTGCYQLDLVTPGISPLRLRLRKQIRHMANLRR